MCMVEFNSFIPNAVDPIDDTLETVALFFCNYIQCDIYVKFCGHKLLNCPFHCTVPAVIFVLINSIVQIM